MTMSPRLGTYWWPVIRAQVRGSFHTMRRSLLCRVFCMLGPSTWYDWNTNAVSITAMMGASKMMPMVENVLSMWWWRGGGVSLRLGTGGNGLRGRGGAGKLLGSRGCWGV